MNDSTLEGLDFVAKAVPHLRRAVRHRELTISSAGFVTGGTRSYEPISLTAHSLLEDVQREASDCEQDLRSELGHNWSHRQGVEEAIACLAVAYEATRDALGATLGVLETCRAVSGWVARCQLVLGQARAPYRLLWPDGSPVACPVVEWRQDSAVACGGVLMVHLDPASAVPTSIRCKRRTSDHAWPSGPAWLRLGALLGAVA